MCDIYEKKKGEPIILEELWWLQWGRGDRTLVVGVLKNYTSIIILQLL